MTAGPETLASQPESAAVKTLDLRSFEDWMKGDAEQIAKLLGYEYNAEFRQILEQLRDMYRAEGVVTTLIGSIAANLFGKQDPPLQRVPRQIDVPLATPPVTQSAIDKSGTHTLHKIASIVRATLRLNGKA